MSGKCEDCGKPIKDSFEYRSPRGTRVVCYECFPYNLKNKYKQTTSLNEEAIPKNGGLF